MTVMAKFVGASAPWKLTSTVVWLWRSAREVAGAGAALAREMRERVRAARAEMENCILDETKVG
jgi:hypothetical protein